VIRSTIYSGSPNLSGVAIKPYPRDAAIQYNDSRQWDRCQHVLRGRPPGRHVHQPSLDGWLALLNGVQLGSAPCCLRSNEVLLDYVGRIRYGVIVLSIAYSTHNSFRATATMARFPPARFAIRS
jgi:hypothetical protein